jgi:hypothetical protein
MEPSIIVCEQRLDWWVMFDIDRPYKKIVLTQKYTPSRYPKYENYDAIYVEDISQIPCDYKGLISVPLSFLNNYNPQQFEILNLAVSKRICPSCKLAQGWQARLIIRLRSSRPITYPMRDTE